jgi:hypothetical protein
MNDEKKRPDRAERQTTTASPNTPAATRPGAAPARAAHTRSSFGELVSAAFDEAMALTRDPRRAATLATELISELLMTTGGERIARRLAAAER